MQNNALLREVFDIPEVVAASDFVLQLHTGVDRASQTVSEYVATESLAQAFDEALGFVQAGLDRNADQGVFLHGTFGAGKSHFMAVLDLMLRGEPAARALPGLQRVVAKHADRALSRKLLTAEYHLIGAKSLEEALFAGFIRKVKALHPDAPAPMLHNTDGLFTDADNRRSVNEATFFAQLNTGKAGGGWGSYGSGWTAERYERARRAPLGDRERDELAADLVRTMFTGFSNAGQWLDISQGLAVMASTTKDLGYDGLVLFLDELVLWLASHAADADFVSEQASRVAKLVETGSGTRAVPLISFVARQRELSDFVGDKAIGVQKAQVGQAIQYWEDRFNTITLAASNLPEVAHRRLLQPRSPEAAAAVARSVMAVKTSASWDSLLLDEAGSGEDTFAKVYPFSPALVDVLIALSGQLQRERTALKVMAHLLSARRDTGRIDEVIGVGDLYDVMIASGEQPLSEDMKHLFAVARRLYETKFAAVLYAQHGLAAGAEVPADHPVHKDARLAKTLLVAALVPSVKSLQRLTAGRLAALNHGTVQAFIPGMEGAEVLGTVRQWAQQIGEIHIGDGSDPDISVELSGVDYDGVLSRVEAEDTPGARRNLLKKLLFAEMGVPDTAQMSFAGNAVEQIWRGTRRVVDVQFANVRDESALPDSMLLADSDRWKLIVDYPFDDGDHAPQEDLDRITSLRIDGVRSRMVAWLPSFLTTARQADLGTLVQLEHLLGGSGSHFEANAAHLSLDQRGLAKQSLDNRRRALTNKIKDALQQAYGIAPATSQDIDRPAFPEGSASALPTLWQENPLRKPAAGTLAAALHGVIDQMLDLEFPDHPRIDPGSAEVRSADLRAMWEVVVRAAAEPHGRLDPVEQNRRAVVRRLAGPLRLGYAGDAHFVFDQANFGWRNEFTQAAAREQLRDGIPVSAIRGWLAPLGLTKEMGNLIIACYALLEDKQFTVHQAVVPVTAPNQIRDEMVLADPRLPDEDTWTTAKQRAQVLFGIQPLPSRTAANVGALARTLRTAARERLDPNRALLRLLRKHSATLALTPQSPRLASAVAGLALVEGLLAAGDDDVALVEALAQMTLPEHPEALANAMSTAGELGAAIEQQDWTMLNAVASAADAGDASAANALAGLRTAAQSEQLHAPLLPRLAAAHTAATQWLVINRPQEPPSDPDDVDIDLPGLDRRLGQVRAEIVDALRRHPAKRPVISWRLE